MSTTITGKLNKPATQFQAGDSTGFGIRLGVKYRDPKTKQDEWTNYQAVIFAKSGGQIQFYQNALIAGSVVEVSAEQLKINSYDGNNGTVLTIDMLNAKLGYVMSGITQHADQYQQQSPQQQYQQAQQNNQQQPSQQLAQKRQQQQQQVNNINSQVPQNDFDDDIPF